MPFFGIFNWGKPPFTAVSKTGGHVLLWPAVAGAHDAVSCRSNGEIPPCSLPARNRTPPLFPAALTGPHQDAPARLPSRLPRFPDTPYPDPYRTPRRRSWGILQATTQGQGPQNVPGPRCQEHSTNSTRAFFFCRMASFGSISFSPSVLKSSQTAASRSSNSSNSRVREQVVPIGKLA